MKGQSSNGKRKNETVVACIRSTLDLLNIMVFIGYFTVKLHRFMPLDTLKNLTWKYITKVHLTTS